MTLVEKVKNRVRLTQEEGEALYELDLFTLGELADEIRREKFGTKSYFNINRHINPTNVCADICKFCAYSASRKNPNQYTMSHEQIMSIVDNSVSIGAKEVHIVSAHNPNDGVEWYMGAFRKIKAKYPDLHVKAMTAAEVDFLTRQYGLSYDEVLD
ncbi:MAG TPA: radical SAM protein, partial [Campylobacterales bacterium]|nr:radical SAM protein [Campylobacterales bacterium]